MTAPIREGGDITYADMIVPPQVASEIQQFFTDCSVLITGAEEYLGKLTLEKLLRSCPDVKRIYILVTVKNGKNEREMLEEIVKVPVSAFQIFKKM